MTDTPDSNLRAAWAALLRGDTAERDRLLARAELQHAAETRAASMVKVLSVDFYVNSRGVAYRTHDMFQATN